MTSQNIRVKNLVMAALFTAIGVVLPQAFHMIPNAGSIILPMHIPVLICGMTVGGFYGAIAGALTVSLSILINGMPPLFPTGVCMIVELAVYGLVSGVAYKALGCRMNRKRTYAALIIAMLAGRAANGLAMTAAMGMAGKAYTRHHHSAGADPAGCDGSGKDPSHRKCLIKIPRRESRGIFLCGKPHVDRHTCKSKHPGQGRRWTDFRS